MRKRRAEKRDVLADPIYNSKVVTKLVNQIMIGGKKGTAQKIVYSAFETVENTTKKPALEVFEAAMEILLVACRSNAIRMSLSSIPQPLSVTRI